MSKTKGTLYTCDACEMTEFLDESVNTEAEANRRGWYQMHHTGIARVLCKSCCDTWDSWNKSFLNILEVMKDKEEE